MTEFRTHKYYAALLAFSGILLAFLVIGDTAVITQQAKLIKEDASRHAEQELLLVERFIRDALLRHDYAQVEDVLVEWGRRHEDIVHVGAVTHNGFVLAAYEGDQPGGPTHTVSSNIELGGTDSVMLEIVIDHGYHAELLERFTAWQIGGSVLLTLLFGVALWQTLRRLALLPMQKEIEKRREAESLLIQAKDELEERVAERTRQLQEREQKVTLLLNSTAEAIFGLDMHGHCTFANPACVRMLGYDNEDALLGKSAHELIHPRRQDGSTYPEEECPVYDAFRTGVECHVDDEVLWRADGSCFAAEYWSYPIDSGGKIVGSVVTFLNIEERKRAEQELRNYHENLEDEVRERTHNLQSALNLMAGREARMAELKGVIRELREQLEAAGMAPLADDPLLGQSGENRIYG